MRTIVLSFLLGLFLMSCGGEQKSQQQQETAKEEEKLEAVVYDAEKAKAPQAYMKLSECLIASNPTAAQTYAKRLKAVMPAEGAEEVNKSIDAIINSADLAAQRKSFEAVTAYFLEVAKKGDAGMDIYLVHCPMAFNNTGADWLSATKEVVNPYFGDEMLHCGRVMETIKGK
ncbi:DUF3347 domain-containing protein [Flammeovirga aprica]|uniref:DUF3347 domain-containing protein n=1 Tax=Flammeovirga aprica JL-4 TaxID=694437 RepID=A0A7X9P1W7_9BACT|nr:DUF3347 domain-containing protein [Flammeovirga aprica]NME68031.1 DUF3347 domain-containing protein [Flammeovirga aprica JL-4]